MFFTDGSGEIYTAKNFKKSNKILSLNSGLLNTIQFMDEEKILISTINGDLYLVKLAGE